MSVVKMLCGGPTAEQKFNELQVEIIEHEEKAQLRERHDDRIIIPMGTPKEREAFLLEIISSMSRTMNLIHKENVKLIRFKELWEKFSHHVPDSEFYAGVSELDRAKNRITQLERELEMFHREHELKEAV